MKPPVKHPVFASVTVALLLFSLAACGSDSDTGVVLGTVELGSVSEVVEAPGAVTARSTVDVSSPANGSVKSLRVVDGQRVRKGQRLAVIDSPQAQANLKAAKQADAAASDSGNVDLPAANVDDAVDQADAAADRAFDQARAAIALIPAGPARVQATAQLARAEAAFAAARAQTLATVGSANSTVRGLEQALGSVTGAGRAQTRAAVTAAERTVDALTVTAPTAGVITFTTSGGGSSPASSSLLDQLPPALQGAASAFGGGGGSASSSGVVVVGDPVTSGQTLFNITNVSSLGMAAQVDETDVLLVRSGIRATVQLDAVPDALYTATVTSVGLTPTTSSRGGVSYIVRLKLGPGESGNAAAPRPLPGMSAVASLQVLTQRNIARVPAAAVFRDGSQDAVWVVIDGTARKRVVTLGAQGEASIAITNGVAEGDTIVVKGADRVREGQALP